MTFVSKHYPGPVITISIEPDIEFNDRSGMPHNRRWRVYSCQDVLAGQIHFKGKQPNK